jgi:hypothetical protein
MTTVEKIDSAISNKYFTLFKEGLFYKCYNEDAMVFVKNVKEYKVSGKFVKSVGADVYSIGFPVSEVEKGKMTLEFITKKIEAKSFEIKDTQVVFLLNDGSLKYDYKEWIDTIQEEEIIKVTQESSSLYNPTLNTTTIISLIKNYDLANSTPMQGLGFIQELKLEVQRIEKNNGNI